MKLNNIIILSLLAVTSVFATRADVFCAGGLCYNTLNGSEAEVIRLPHEQNVTTPYKGVYVIPERVFFEGRNYKVTAIADSAFFRSQVVEVQIPNTVTSIGTGAFAEASSLTDITLPLNLKTVSEAVLAGTSIAAIVIPDGVKTLGDRAFEACTQLHTVLLPSSVKLIEDRAFAHCYNLYEIYCAAPVPPRVVGEDNALVLKNVDVVVPDDDAVMTYADSDAWCNQENFNLFPNEDVSVTMSGETEVHNGNYMRVKLGGNLAYKIYDGDELVALTAATRYYMPVRNHAVPTTIVPTTLMGADATPVDVVNDAVTATGVEQETIETAPTVYAHDGVLYISGDNYGKWTYVYDMYGRLYYQRPSIAGEVIELPRNRVYIVIVGNHVKKVFL